MITKTHPTLISDVLASNFGEVVNEFFAQDRSLRSNPLLPAIDFIEKDKSYLLRASLPGLNKKDIEIKLDGNRLTLNAERKPIKSEDEKKHIQEIRFGHYSRTVKLPRNTDVSKIKAEYENGLLNLTIEKKKEDQPKVIEIK